MEGLDGDDNDRGDESGEMGDNLLFINFGKDRTVEKIAPGHWHNCVLLDNKSVVCAGENEYGQIGIETTTDTGISPSQVGDNFVAVSLGLGEVVDSIFSGPSAHHTCVILVGSKIKCWGLNVEGQLGLGDVNNRGDEPNEMGDNLPVVDIGAATPISISAGTLHTCVLLDDKTSKCWGYNEYGNLVIGSVLSVGNEPNEMGANLKVSDWGKGLKISSLLLGWDFSCALLSDGKIKCFGYNKHGELGQGNKRPRGQTPNSIGNKLRPIKLGCSTRVKQIAVGSEHSCVLFADGKVKCWGKNNYGTLGIGSKKTIGDNKKEMSKYLKYVNV